MTASVTCGGDHHPRDAWRLELAHGVRDVLGEHRSLSRELTRNVEVPVDGDHLVPALEQPKRHVVAHLAQTDHREAHVAKS